MHDGTLMIVRHGGGRGRLPGYLQEALDHLAVSAPALHRRLRFHDTSHPLPDLTDVRAVVFWLADPLRERYPDCFAHAAALADAARDRGIRLVNAPESLSNSIKSVQATRWQAADVPTPDLHRFADRDELAHLFTRGDYPLLLRCDVLHSQQGMRVVADRTAADRLLASTLVYPGALGPLVDTREGYRTSAPDSVWARYFHKKRAFVFGDVVTTNHLYFSSSPIVGLSGCTFSWYTGRIRRRLGSLARIFPADRACLAADQAFSAGEPEHPDVMRRAARALDLEFVAIDYSTFADGRVVLWEANPYFFLHRPGRGVLPRERDLEQRTRHVYDRIGMFFQSLIRDGQ